MIARWISLAVLLAALAACGPKPESQETPPAPPAEPAPTAPAPPPAEPGQTPAAAESPVAATVEDGVQVARLEVTEDGFVPSAVEFQAGTPARFLITRKTDQTCATAVMSKDLSIAKTDLPMGKEVAVDFTPPATGRYTFGCGMDMMIKGAVIVPPGEPAGSPSPTT